MSNLLELNRFFVNQKAKLIELTNEYKILDENGQEVGAIRQEGQSKLKKFARLISNVDQFLTHHLGVYDSYGQKVVSLTRPAKFLKSKVQVTDAAGQPVGVIEQQNVIGKIRFGLMSAGGEALGAINAENWRAWNFQIADAGGAEVGRITKKWAGVGKEMFTTADNYMISIASSPNETVNLLLLAAGLAIDTVYKEQG